MNCPKCHKLMPLVELKEKSARYECDEHGSHEVSITEEERSRLFSLRDELSLGRPFYWSDEKGSGMEF